MSDTITLSKSSLMMYTGIFVIVLVGSVLISSGGGALNLTLPATGAVVAGPQQFPTTYNVDIRNSEYFPPTITVNKGKSITLTVNNRDSGLTHGVQLPDYGIGEHVPPLQSKTFQFVASIPGSNDGTGSTFTSCNPSIEVHSEKLEIIVV